jgi:hypothetical protein
VRYPYQTTPDYRDIMIFAIRLNMIGMKTKAQETLTMQMFHNRNRPQVVSEILKDWLQTYKTIKQEERELKKEFGLKVKKPRDVYQGLIASLSHAYYNYYMYPWLKENAHRDFNEIKKEAERILLLIREDIKASAFPAKLKQDLWQTIKRRFESELWDAYKAIIKRDLPEMIEKRIREKQMMEVE